jgi:(R,R)-butanediol dehydrogenase / meso-butanediol dehydrogenase / diacetyl reductase
VRVRACGLCGSDLHVVHNPTPLVAPGTIMGHEMAGTVDALGEGVDNYSAGEAVVIEPLRTCGICEWCRMGRDSICSSMQLNGIHIDGGFADYITVPAHRLFRIPSDFPFNLAALAEPIAVAVHGLRMGRFRKDSRVLVLGAGTIGLAVTAVARLWGAGEILLTARHPHQVKLGRALGASEVILDQDATVETMTSLGKQRPAELVVETVGGSANTLLAAGAALAQGGVVSVLGVFTAPALIDGFALFFKEATLQFSNCYSRAPGQVDFDEAIRLLKENANGWSSLLTHSVSLDDFEGAFALASDKSQGAVKITVMTNQ